MATIQDVKQTLDDYAKACEDYCIPEHPLIQSMLEREKDESVKNNSGECQYYLGGNNQYLADNRLGDPDCVTLCVTFATSPCLIKLDLRFNQISDIGAEDIGNLIWSSKSLKYLNLMGNDIGPEGAMKIAHALHDNKSVETLVMTGNKIGNKGGLVFAQALQLNTTLKELDLGDTDLKAESLIAIATVLKYNTTITALNVSRPLLSSTQEETTIHFAEMLKTNSTLKELHLMKYSMSDDGARRLAENLMENFTLEYLNLGCNRLTRDGAQAFAGVLERNTGLKKLDFSFNRFGDDGAVYFAEVLTFINKNLEGLSLQNNEIRGKGLCAIAECLKRNTTLQQVYIWGNELEPSVCLAFRGLIDNGRLKSANTDVEPYIVDEETYLAQLTNGLQISYYWLPSFGTHKDPHIAALVQEKLKKLEAIRKMHYLF